MGLFEVNVTVANPADRKRSAAITLLVDTGATLSWVARATLEAIGISPLARRSFLLADGRRVERDTGIVVLALDGLAIGTTVVFAEAGEGSMLGATALEAFGVAVDPVEKKLLPRDLMALVAKHDQGQILAPRRGDGCPRVLRDFSRYLEGFTGVGNSVEDCLYKARWGMEAPVPRLREQGLTVPPQSETRP